MSQTFWVQDGPNMRKPSPQETPETISPVDWWSISFRKRSSEQVWGTEYCSTFQECIDRSQPLAMFENGITSGAFSELTYKKPHLPVAILAKQNVPPAMIKHPRTETLIMEADWLKDSVVKNPQYEQENPNIRKSIMESLVVIQQLKEEIRTKGFIPHLNAKLRNEVKKMREEVENVKKKIEDKKEEVDDDSDDSEDHENDQYVQENDDEEDVEEEAVCNRPAPRIHIIGNTGGRPKPNQNHMSS